MKKLGPDLDEFKNMVVSYDKEKERENKYNALSSDFQTWCQKFESTRSDIQHKKKMYAEVANRNSISSRDDMEYGAPTGVGGQQRQQLLDKETIRIQAETDFNA